MQRWFASLVLAGVVSIVLAGGVSAQVQVQAQAGQIQIQVPAQPGVQIRWGRTILPAGYNQARVTEADAIFVGRVVGMEPMDVEAEPAKGQQKATYRIAMVEVTEAIHGLKKDTKMLRIAFPVQPDPQFNGGGVQIQPRFQNVPAFRSAGNLAMTLQLGQDGLFAVNKHFKENFYLSPSFPNFVSRENNPSFDGDLKSAKQMAKVIGNPAAGLKSDDKNDRYLAAAILVSKYRTSPTGTPMKAEAIDPAESKLILQAIAGGDWANTRYNGIVPNPVELFRQLGVNVQPNNAQGMQKWLDGNAGKYVIQKLVADPNGKTGQPNVQPGVRPGVRPLPPAQFQPAPKPE